jgi:hypothetical protein
LFSSGHGFKLTGVSLQHAGFFDIGDHWNRILATITAGTLSVIRLAYPFLCKTDPTEQPDGSYS